MDRYAIANHRKCERGAEKKGTGGFRPLSCSGRAASAVPVFISVGMILLMAVASIICTTKCSRLLQPTKMLLFRSKSEERTSSTSNCSNKHRAWVPCATHCGCWVMEGLNLQFGATSLQLDKDVVHDLLTLNEQSSHYRQRRMKDKPWPSHIKRRPTCGGVQLT